MRKATLKMSEIVDMITGMKGKRVDMEVNRGRKRIERYVGVIEKIYPSVFTVNIDSPENKGKQSYSFNEVLCGDVTIKSLDEA